MSPNPPRKSPSPPVSNRQQAQAPEPAQSAAREPIHHANASAYRLCEGGGGEEHLDVGYWNIARHVRESAAEPSGQATAAAPLTSGSSSVSATEMMLSARSRAALARLRNYGATQAAIPSSSGSFAAWTAAPASRRAAVLVLLFPDRAGELRVVLTTRSAQLRSFGGHAAFPGGKADSTTESAWRIARREAREEIGLPDDIPDFCDCGSSPQSPSSPTVSAFASAPASAAAGTLHAGRISADKRTGAPSASAGWRVEHLCLLPCSLARSELIVRPCVAFLHAPPPGPAAEVDADAATRDQNSLLPKLDAREVEAVFSGSFYNFLLCEDEPLPAVSSPSPSQPNDGAIAVSHQKSSSLPPGPWYTGFWSTWHEEPWRMHFFYVPVTDQQVERAREQGEDVKHHIGGSVRALASTGQSADATDVAEKDRRLRQNRSGETTASQHVAESSSHPGRFKVWGMTARILVDAARIAYDRPPDFEHNADVGDEPLIAVLGELGLLGTHKRRLSVPIPPEDLRRAKAVLRAREGTDPVASAAAVVAAKGKM